MTQSLREGLRFVEGIAGRNRAGARSHRGRCNGPIRVEPLESRRLLSAGALDTTFGTDGEVLSNALPTYGAADAAVQADGKIVVAGSKVGRNHAEDFTVVRFNANGSVDGSFGAGGIVVSPVIVGGILESATATGIAVLPDGKILVAGLATPVDFDGSQPWNVVVARYDANGSMDTTFGDNGEAVLQCDQPGSIVTSGRLAVLGDGTIVVNAFEAGPGPGQTSLLAVFTSAGKADKVFDPQFERGMSPLPPGVNTYPILPSAIAAMPNDQFLVAGYDPTGYSSSGQLYDESFAVLSEQGQVTATSSDAFVGKQTSLNNDAQVGAVAAVAGGKFILAGYAQAPKGTVVESGFALSQYDANGSIDTSLNGGTEPYGPGTTLTSVNGGGVADAAAVEPGGKILLAGTVPASNGSSQEAFALVRYDANGSLDSTFGVGGIAITQAASPTTLRVLLQPGGKIVVVGDRNGELILLRYQGDTPATVTGTVFNDKNGNGIANSGEDGLADVEVYADLNNAGIYQSGDPIATTNSSGHYTLSGLTPGSYVIRQLLPTGYHQTAPSDGYGNHLSILAGQTLSGENFGDLI